MYNKVLSLPYRLEMLIKFKEDKPGNNYIYTELKLKTFRKGKEKPMRVKNK